MAKRKRSLYKNLDISAVKVELQRNINYIQSVDIEQIDDELDEDMTATGGKVLRVIASIEQKLDSLITLIKDSIDQLKYITDLEGADEFVEHSISALKDSLKMMQAYYDARPPESLQMRVHWVERKTKRGSYQMKKIAANVPTQIKNRSKVLKIILDLQPTIAQIEEAREEEISLKGDKEIPISLIGLVK